MHQLFVGAYTGGSSEGIHIFQWDESNDRYQPKQVIKSEHPSYLAFNKNGNVFYAANEIGADRPGRVSAFHLENGQWQLINDSSSEGADPCHLLLTPNERYLIVSNYSGGSLAVYELGLDHGLRAAVQVLAFSGGSQVRPEQEAAHIHSTLVSPDGQYVFAFDLGNDCLYRFPLDEVVAPGANSPLDFSQQTTIELTPGSGPRMGRFSPNGRFLYVLSELDGSIEVFSYRQGKLESIQRVALVDPARDIESAENSGAELVFTQDGNILLASNRGNLNEIVSFHVNHETGHLDYASAESTGGTIPRHFTPIDDKGILVANQGSGSLVLIDHEAGESLRRHGVVAEIDQPAFVFVDNRSH
ncbi:6-phosphogluconolactonase [Halomonadaceae bacterium LMG 33818]|uniref:lactonase family protein n=1 Tax=Cernens ardua TaxID=3402176 RepID=UPI003EDC72D5